MPTARATASAVRRSSPVSNTVSMPRRPSSAMAWRLVGFTGSATAMRPATPPSIMTKTGVLPSAPSRADSVARTVGSAPSSRTSAALPTATRLPWVLPAIPLPVRLSKSVAARGAAPRRLASATTASARGCSLLRSTAAASWSSRVSSPASPASIPGASTTLCTVGRPAVMVPVLSNTTVSTASLRWSTSPPLISTPSSAPRPVDTMTAVGTARPMAHGQAMISTVTAETSPWR